MKKDFIVYDYKNNNAKDISWDKAFYEIACEHKRQFDAERVKNPKDLVDSYILVFDGETLLRIGECISQEEISLVVDYGFELEQDYTDDTSPMLRLEDCIELTDEVAELFPSIADKHMEDDSIFIEITTLINPSICRCFIEVSLCRFGSDTEGHVVTSYYVDVEVNKLFEILNKLDLKVV